MAEKDDRPAWLDSWKIDERPARGRWAPGDYLGTCSVCNTQYQGDKRATICADCAYAEPEVQEVNNALNMTAPPSSVELGSPLPEDVQEATQFLRRASPSRATSVLSYILKARQEVTRLASQQRVGWRPIKDAPVEWLKESSVKLGAHLGCVHTLGDGTAAVVWHTQGSGKAELFFILPSPYPATPKGEVP